jgi:MFS family permease
VATRANRSADLRFLTPIVVGTSLNPMNSTLISISLVLIADSLDVPLHQTLYLVVGFYVASAIGQPILGNVADRVAPYPLFMAGLGSVAVAGVVGGLGQNIATLTVARVLLALGTASLYPAAIVMVRGRFEREGSTAFRALSLIAVTQQLAAALAPPVGGLLIGVWGWRLTFVANIPLSLAAMALAYRAARQGVFPAHTTRHRATTRPSLDLVGCCLFAATLGMLFLVAGKTGLPGWVSATAFVAAMAALIVWERRTPSPLIDVRMLVADPGLAWIFVRFVMVGSICYSMLLLWPQWLQQGRGLSVAAAGLILLPMPILAPPVALLAARYANYRWSLVTAHLAMLIGSIGLLLLHRNAPIWLLATVVACFAVPTGLLHQANQAAVFERAPRDRTGSSVGLLRSMWYVGAIVASAMGGFFFADRATTHGLHALGATLFAMAALVVVVDGVVALRSRVRIN